MKQLKKLGLSLVLLSFTTLMLFAYASAAFAAGNTDFVVKDGVLIEYQGKDAEVTIPENWGITTIGVKAFYKNGSITSVVIPKGVTVIGNSAFDYCGNLTSITIPESVTSIGSYAFQSTGLKSVSLPNSITSIDVGLFANCNNLFSIKLSDNIKTIPDAMFYNCQRLSHITIPYGVTSIVGEAFFGCTYLRNVTMPETLTDIAPHAFFNCEKLATITGIKGSRAEEYAKDVLLYPGGGEGLWPRIIGARFIPQTFSPGNITVSIDGKNTTFTTYNIRGNNYFKLRDLAQALNVTNKQFAVEWNGKNSEINLTKSTAYTPIGGELLLSGSAEKQVAAVSAAAVKWNGSPVEVKAYNINGNNYFKLRDLAKFLNFAVIWYGKAIGIDTAKGYSD